MQHLKQQGAGLVLDDSLSTSWLWDELQCIICKDGHVDLRSTILYWTRSDANVLDNRCMSSRFTTHVFQTIQDNRSSHFNAFGRINQVSWEVSNHVKCRDVSARECRSLPKECKMTRAKIEGKVRHLISSMQWPGVTILNLPPQKSGNFPVEKRKKGRKKFMQWTQPKLQPPSQPPFWQLV